MTYYAGDYYRGDYYRGDPGLIDFFKKAVGTVARVGGAVLGTTPIGGVIRAGSQVFRGQPAPQAPQLRPVSGQQPVLRQAPTREISVGPGGAVYKHTEYGVQTSMRANGDACGGGDGCPKGYHLNKADSPTKGPKGTYCVKNRRMNVANPKALRRGIRRSRGFVKTFRKAAGSVGMVVYSKQSPKMRKRGR